MISCIMNEWGVLHKHYANVDKKRYLKKGERAFPFGILSITIYHHTLHYSSLMVSILRHIFLTQKREGQKDADEL